MKLFVQRDEPDDRDEVLGRILRNAVDAAAGQVPSGFSGPAASAMLSRRDEAVSPPSSQARRGEYLRWATAAAVVVFLVISAAAGFRIAGRALIRSSSLEVARSIMPERSDWVPEAISGDGPPSGAVAEFVESLWSSGNGGGGLGPVF